MEVNLYEHKDSAVSDGGDLSYPGHKYGMRKSPSCPTWMALKICSMPWSGAPMALVFKLDYTISFFYMLSQDLSQTEDL